MVITERLPRGGCLTRASAKAKGLRSATLDLHLRSAHLDLRSKDLGDVLVDYAAHRPVLSLDRPTGCVHAGQASSVLDGPHPPDVEALLNSRLPWTLRVRAAGMSGWLDLRSLRLNGLDVSARNGRFRADLPAPAAPVLLRVGGRGAQVTLSVPEGTAVRVWQEDGWEVVGQRSTGPVPRERYDVWLDGGSGCCRLETRRGELAGLARPSFHIVG